MLYKFDINYPKRSRTTFLSASKRIVNVLDLVLHICHSKIIESIQAIQYLYENLSLRSIQRKTELPWLSSSILLGILILDMSNLSTFEHLYIV